MTSQRKFSSNMIGRKSTKFIICNTEHEERLNRPIPVWSRLRW